MPRALLALEKSTQITAANQIASRKMSVREAEALVKKLSAEFALTSTKPKKEKSRDLKRLEEELSDLLAADVEVRTALAGAFAQLRARMTEALASAGTPHAEGLAVLIVATYEGGLLQARVANSVLPLQLATDTLGALIRAQPAAAA